MQLLLKYGVSISTYPIKLTIKSMFVAPKKVYGYSVLLSCEKLQAPVKFLNLKPSRCKKKGPF